MNINPNMKTNDVHTYACSALPFKPILVGALVSIGLSFLLNLFGAAIGLTAFTTNSGGVETLALGGLLATSVGIVASMFASGWLTGYLSMDYTPRRHLGALYGFLAWTVALIITIFVAGYLQKYISFYTHLISGTGAAFHAETADAVATVSGKVSDKNLVISSYIVFSLFFLSAFACSLGGHAGMQYEKQNRSPLV